MTDEKNELVPIAGDSLPGEKDFNVYCSNEYLSLGPGRTLGALHIHLQQQLNEGIISVLPSQSQLSKWYRRFEWSMRATQYDGNVSSLMQTKAAIVFEHKLAKTWGRVDTLIKLADLLENELIQKLWQPKQAATKNKKDVVMALNVPLIQQLRGVLKDIAEETGGRQRGGASGTVQDSVEQEQAVNLENMTDEEIDALSDLLNKVLDDN